MRSTMASRTNAIEVAAARLRRAAAGQREFAAQHTGRTSARAIQEYQRYRQAALVLEMAAEIVEGNTEPLYVLLPKSHWTDEMRRGMPAL